MQPITLEQFIKTYNFRYCHDDQRHGEDFYDTKIVRFRTQHATWDWFEFGTYDFDSCGAWSRAQAVLNDSILRMVVNDFYYDDDLGVFVVELVQPEEWIDDTIMEEENERL